jgi:hypothetical protein
MQPPLMVVAHRWREGRMAKRPVALKTDDDDEDDGGDPDTTDAHSHGSHA